MSEKKQVSSSQRFLKIVLLSALIVGSFNFAQNAVAKCNQGNFSDLDCKLSSTTFGPTITIYSTTINVIPHKRLARQLIQEINQYDLNNQVKGQLLSNYLESAQELNADKTESEFVNAIHGYCLEVLQGK